MDAEEPTPQYLKGFNSGYQIAKYDPELFGQLAKSSHLNKDNDYMRGLETWSDNFFFLFTANYFLVIAMLRQDV